MAKWFQKEFLNYCVNTKHDRKVIEAYKKIINWVNKNSQFTSEPKRDFASGADEWIVAYAMVYNCIVVTHERYDPNVKKKFLFPMFAKSLMLHTLIRSI